MTWHRIGDKPLSETKVTQFIYASPGLNELTVLKDWPDRSWADIGKKVYCQTSNISCTLVGNKIVDHSDVVGASPSPVGTVPTTSSFSTEHPALMDWAKTNARLDEKHLSLGIWCDLY